MKWKWFLAATLFFCTTVTWAAETSSPYSGQETREIKALSRDEISGYLSGDGMGFAKAAELNHYPGPKMSCSWRISCSFRRSSAEKHSEYLTR
jgi:hypothetical protein